METFLGILGVGLLSVILLFLLYVVGSLLGSALKALTENDD